MERIVRYCPTLKMEGGGDVSASSLPIDAGIDELLKQAGDEEGLCQQVATWMPWV
jgi:hypothetical protein